MTPEGKVLVVWYSRTGNTRAVGESIAAQLSADAEQIEDKKKRNGVLGFMGGGKDALKKNMTEIAEPAHDPSAYGLVVLGTPVWASTMAPAVRTYLSQYQDKLPQVAFFLTTGGSGIDRTFRHMSDLCGKEPLAVLGLRDKVVKKGDPADEIRAFVETLRTAQPG
jgi:flavodoxin